MNATVTPLDVRVLDAQSETFSAELQRLIDFEVAQDPKVDATVAAIVADVRLRGDAAVIEYTRRFDRRSVQSVAELALDGEDMQAAYEALPQTQREALKLAATRVRAYHEQQKSADWSVRDT